VISKINPVSQNSCGCEVCYCYEKGLQDFSVKGQIWNILVNILGVLFLHHCEQIPEENSYRKKDLFWLMISEILVHSLWLYLFRAHSEAEHHVKVEVIYLMVNRKHKITIIGRGQDNIYLPETCLHWPIYPK
jgi:hypothetical protein